MRCKCGEFSRDEFDKEEYIITEYSCPKCGVYYRFDEDGERIRDYGKAWRELTTWLNEKIEKHGNRFGTYEATINKMKELINE